MSEVTVYGPVQSTFLRTVRMVCAEKGVACAVEEADFHSAPYRALHPFGKIPAFRHGDFVLYETCAIIRYVDRVFPGPALQPADHKALARMEQWMSATCDYLYQVMIRELVWQRLVVPMMGGQPDEACIAAAVPKLAEQLGIVEATLAKQPYLAGDTATLADFLLLPILDYVKVTPEGQAALPKAPSVAAWIARMAARQATIATDPIGQH